MLIAFALVTCRQHNTKPLLKVSGTGGNGFLEITNNTQKDWDLKAFIMDD